MSRGRPHVLLLEPYDGGSHARLLDDLERRLPFRFTRLGLPARNWKWRMRFAAPLLARRAAAMEDLREGVDAVFASTFLDLPTWKALAPPRLGRAPALVYFHENQLNYPRQVEDVRDLHFGITNLLSALAAERCLFNTRYNLESFLEELAPLLARAPDMELGFALEAVRRKSAVLHVPLDLEREPPSCAPRPEEPPLILWNHRWEHDKDPEAFFRALLVLAEEGLPFRVAVCGESFARRPPVFAEARAALGDRVVRWGTVPDREEYLGVLREAAVVVSTARHEFQGLAVLEAVAQGAAPVLPRRLSYPELFPDERLWRDEKELLSMLRSAVIDPPRPSPTRVRGVAERFSWTGLEPAWRREFDALTGR